MIKKIAYIKTPFGSVDTVEVSKYLIDGGRAIEIRSKSGEVFITHLSNVLILKVEVEEQCESKE